MNEFFVKIKNQDFYIKILNNSSVLINEKEVHYEFEKGKENHLLIIDNKSYKISSLKNENEHLTININGESFNVEIRSLVKEKARKFLEQKVDKKHNIEVKAPMPGLIHNIQKKKGDFVKSGEAVLILEAMKMENEIRSPIDGIIKELLVMEGNIVEKGISLFILEQPK